QVVLPLLASDAVDLFEAVAERRLAEAEVALGDETAACVVLAAAGYPGAAEKGRPISGVEAVPDGVVVFHAGTARGEDGALVTAGGRVLGVTGFGPDLQRALDRAYA